MAAYFHICYYVKHLALKPACVQQRFFVMNGANCKTYYAFIDVIRCKTC